MTGLKSPVFELDDANLLPANKKKSTSKTLQPTTDYKTNSYNTSEVTLK